MIELEVRLSGARLIDADGWFSFFVHSLSLLPFEVEFFAGLLASALLSKVDQLVAALHEVISLLCSGQKERQIKNDWQTVFLLRYSFLV